MRSGEDLARSTHAEESLKGTALIGEGRTCCSMNQPPPSLVPHRYCISSHASWGDFTPLGTALLQPPRTIPRAPLAFPRGSSPMPWNRPP